MRMRMSAGSRGLTLVEVLMTLVIFAACAGAFAGFYVMVGRLAESSRNTTQAMNHARTLLERMRDTAQAGGLTGAGGVTAVYRPDQPLAGVLGLDPAVEPLLTRENVTVSYADPDTGVTNLTADPLPVTVQVSWQESGQNRSAQVNTLLTRR